MASTSSELSPALRMSHISKRFPGTLAVNDVTFSVTAGEVHALVGENGAGKSTLMKILSGAFSDYSGEISIAGKGVILHTPAQAKALGIEMIHQELSLAPPVSIAENLLAGCLPARRGIINRGALLAEARRWLAEVGLAHLDPDVAVEELSQHEAQLVEIAKALSNKPSILVMDEPTSALSRDEVDRLFAIVRQLRARGLAIIYISHHLSEIMQIADRVTVLRDGRLIDTLTISAVTAARLVELMVGRKVEERAAGRARQPGEMRFRVERFTRTGFFHDINLEIRAGEVLGLAGLTGAGRTELGRSLCGIDPRDGGRIFLDGREIASHSLRAAMRHGLAYLSEDRKLDGLALLLTAQQNLLAAYNAKARHYAAGAAARTLFTDLAGRLHLYPAEPNREVNQFSGGNQQKLLFGKWLATAPTVCLLDEPTRGVDVGAKQVIHEAILALADAGACVLLISDDLPELVNLSDRIYVMRRGRIVRELPAGCTEEAVLMAANGEVS